MRQLFLRFSVFVKSVNKLNKLKGTQLCKTTIKLYFQYSIGPTINLEPSYKITLLTI